MKVGKQRGSFFISVALGGHSVVICIASLPKAYFEVRIIVSLLLALSIIRVYDSFIIVD